VKEKKKNARKRGRGKKVKKGPGTEKSQLKNCIAERVEERSPNQGTTSKREPPAMTSGVGLTRGIGKGRSLLGLGKERWIHAPPRGKRAKKMYLGGALSANNPTNKIQPSKANPKRKRKKTK